MNKQFAIGFQSLLLVGALLPFSPLMPTERPLSELLLSEPPLSEPPLSEPWAMPRHYHSVFTAPESDPEAEPVAFGRGAPRFRSGGGTR